MKMNAIINQTFGFFMLPGSLINLKQLMKIPLLLLIIRFMNTDILTFEYIKKNLLVNLVL